MRPMPKPPREAEYRDHQIAVNALQRWIWACVEAGWSTGAGEFRDRWTDEDRQASLQLGWMIAQAPGVPYLDLFSLKVGVRPSEIMETILAAVGTMPVCDKAAAVLTAERLKHPNVQFSYMRK